MKYINTFKNHASYEEKLNGGGVDISLPNISYCEDVKDIHYNPYNTVEFYVGNITGTTPQTVKIYTDSSTSVDVQVSEGNKWYTYVLPKVKGLYGIESGIYDDEEETWSNGIVTKTVIKANISYYSDGNFERYNGMIPWGITEVSFKGSDTSNVTDMGYMFSHCSGLTSLDLSSFDTSKVTDMNGMFIGCKGFTSLDLSNFDTSNVTMMINMFSGCNSLKSLDLSGWDTSNVTNMNNMFYNCSGLISLDLRSFDTSKVTSMRSMFNGCSGLTSLDLSKWDTSKVTGMDSMFNNCIGLTSLDLSKWDTSKVTNMNGMFNGCTALTTIRMVGCGSTTIQKITNVKPSSARIVTE